MSAQPSTRSRLREKAASLAARMRRLAGMGCSGLLIAVLAVLAITLLLRALAALLEALAVLALAAVTVMLLFAREWPEAWSQNWQAARDTGLNWLHAHVCDQRPPAARETETTGEMENTDTSAQR